MQVYRYTAKWRDTSKEVEVVLHPPKQWFASLNRDPHAVARFALMTNGDLYFGDAYTVMHHDICVLCGPEKDNPIVVGSMFEEADGGWRIGTIQFFMSLHDRVESARQLMRKHVDWLKMVKELGCNPFDKLTFDEEVMGVRSGEHDTGRDCRIPQTDAGQLSEAKQTNKLLRKVVRAIAEQQKTLDVRHDQLKELRSNLQNAGLLGDRDAP